MPAHLTVDDLEPAGKCAGRGIRQPVELPSGQRDPDVDECFVGLDPPRLARFGRLPTRHHYRAATPRTDEPGVDRPGHSSSAPSPKTLRITRRYRIAFVSERTCRSGPPTRAIPERRNAAVIHTSSLLDDFFLREERLEHRRVGLWNTDDEEQTGSALIDRLHGLEERLPQITIRLLAAQQDRERHHERVSQPALGRHIVVGQLAQHRREAVLVLIE